MHPLQVAVVGIATDFPGGKNRENLDYSSFFQFLLEKGDAYETIPAERFNVHTLKGPGIGQLVTDTGTFLKNIDHFDYMEFGITGKDVRMMTLSTRKLIEVTFLALLDSGVDYRGKNVGCYMAGVAHDIVSVSGQDDNEARNSFAPAPAMLANRVSYHLDLRGPSIPLDTACSSTLSATHLAVQAIRNGECETAVVGGAQINHRFAEWLLYTQCGILAKDGKCKPFNTAADGFSRGEGVATIVLKALDAAIRDNDKIYATILGTCVNSCGSLAPVNAPVASAQADAMKRAFAQAQRKPQEVDFIELHATGTAQGDPTESNWVGEHFQRDDLLKVGSVKGNIGHLEITSFLASLCKVCAILDTRLIPPNVNAGTLNPAIKWSEYKLHVPLQTEELGCRSPSGRPLIAMTSSGIGGANGHCVVEGPPTHVRLSVRFWMLDSPAPAVLIAAGLTPRSSVAIAESLKKAVNTCDLLSISRTCARRARSLTWRSFAVHWHDQLTRFSEPSLVPKTPAPIVFVFSGQGPQHVNMGRELFKTCSVFRESVLEMDRIYASIVGHSLIEKHGLFDNVVAEERLEEIWPISVTLPSLAIVHMAVFDTLVALGIKPDVIVGHSAGETAVVYTSGSGSKAMALELAVARGRAMALVESAGGAMAALSCTAEEAHSMIASTVVGRNIEVELGCYNAPSAVTISGSGEQVDAVVRKAQEMGIFGRRLRTKVPVHSQMMELCKDQYREWVADVFAHHPVQRPATKVYSTKTGTILDQPFTAEYFWDSTRGPVRFAQAIQALASDHANASYIEMGPHPVLGGYISSMVGTGSLVVCPLNRAKPMEDPAESRGLLEAVGKLVVAGHNCIDFDVLCGVPSIEPYDVNYPFAKRAVSYVAPTMEITRQRQHRNGPLNYPQLQINASTHPGLAEHVIKDEPIMPAAGYMEMALEFGARQLWNVEFISMLPLSSERATPINVDLQDGKWAVRSVAPADVNKIWPPKYSRLHACGYLSTTLDPADTSTAISINEIKQRLKMVDTRDLYQTFAKFAQFGPTYRRIVECYMGVDDVQGQEVLARLRGRDQDLPDLEDYVLHPAILDSSLHIAAHPLMTGFLQGTRYYLPSKVGRLRLCDAAFRKPFPEYLYAYGKCTRWTPNALFCDFTIVDPAGQALFVMNDLEFALHGTLRKSIQRYEVVFQPLKLPPSIERERKPSRRFVTLEYIRGDEMDIQKTILTFDSLEPHRLWFTASSGLHGDAALGFTRSLRKEYPLWTVRVAIFEPSWSLKDRATLLEGLSSRDDCEGEVYVSTSGEVTVPRIAPSTPPRVQMEFDSSLPWIFDGRQVTHVLNTPPLSKRVLIRVELASQPVGDIWSFVGLLENDRSRIAGVTTGPLSNLVTSNPASLCSIPYTAEFPDNLQPNFLAYAIAVHAVGIRAFEVPSRLGGRSILVTHTSESLAASLANIFNRHGTASCSVSSAPSIRELQTYCSRKFDVVIVGPGAASYEREMLQNALFPHGKMFLWADAQNGIPNLLESDPWTIGDALKCAAHDDATRTNLVPPLDLVDMQLPRQVDFNFSPFNANKSYLLIGGIGSLGVEIALWMYQRGARSIILTSRSGRKSITDKGSTVAKKILSYLETLPGLDLRLAAADATSVAHMQTLADSVTKPLGGCMLLSMVLSDRSFASQTHESFEAPFAPKVEGFKVMEQTLPINSLDFIITFSSISGMFGNTGQTNYASANTILAGLTKKYRNAFSLVVPGIVDSAIVLNDGAVAAKITHLSSWGMTCAELCEYIEDGIRKLTEGPVWQYIPGLDWNLAFENIGSSPLYNHFVTQTQRDSSDAEASATESVRDIVCRILDVPADDLSPEIPLTSYGLDSLSAASLSYALAPFVRISQIQLLADMTANQIEKRVEAAKNAKAGQTESQSKKIDITQYAEHISIKAHEMVAMVDRYTQFEDVTNARRGLSEPSEKVVLLTGTTGSLGSHVLHLLLQDDTVKRVYALLRKKDEKKSSQDRQLEALSVRALQDERADFDKLVVLEAGIGSGSIGLDKDAYDEVFACVTHIIHMGWGINFSASLAAFESDIRALRELIDLALGSPSRPPAKLIFTSTAGVFRNLQALPAAPVSETITVEAEVAVGTGYSESKWVAERVLAVASDKTGLKATTVRLHQLTGSCNGIWNMFEWFPSMVATGVELGCIPNEDDECSWVPVDIAASVMLDIMDSAEPVLHLRHPNPVPLSMVTNTVAYALRLPLVSYDQWIERLEYETGRVSRGEYEPSPRLRLGLRLLDIYRGPPGMDRSSRVVRDSFGLMAKLDIRRTLGSSRTLRSPDVRQLSEADVMQWLSYWQNSGLL